MLDHERGSDQPLEVDLDLLVDLAAAGASDDLADTVDYGAVCDTVAATVAEGHVALLEHLAARVADAVLAADARIEARRPRHPQAAPAGAADLATSGVRIVRGRA